MNSFKYPLSRNDDLVVQDLNDEILIYDLKNNRAFCLNETSAFVWQACDGTKSIAEISALISQKMNSPAYEDLVWFAIDQLKKEELLENSDELPNYFAGISRREVIKKVGLGTMIALPVVAGIIAPEAIQAGSCGNIAIGRPCPQGNCQCESGCCNVGNCSAVGVIALNGICSSSCACNSGCCNGVSNSCMNSNQGDCLP